MSATRPQTFFALDPTLLIVKRPDRPTDFIGNPDDLVFQPFHHYCNTSVNNSNFRIPSEPTPSSSRNSTYDTHMEAALGFVAHHRTLENKTISDRRINDYSDTVAERCHENQYLGGMADDAYYRLMAYRKAEDREWNQKWDEEDGRKDDCWLRFLEDESRIAQTEEMKPRVIDPKRAAAKRAKRYAEWERVQAQREQAENQFEAMQIGGMFVGHAADNIPYNTHGLEKYGEYGSKVEENRDYNQYCSRGDISQQFETMSIDKNME